MGYKLAQIVYEGKWFTPLREAVQAFVESTQEYVTGEVKFKLYKGNIIKAGTTSPYSLYSESLASFTTGDLYDHHDADGFITLFGLPLKVRAMKMAEVESAKRTSKETGCTVTHIKMPRRYYIFHLRGISLCLCHLSRAILSVETVSLIHFYFYLYDFTAL